jgi:hypothetical protein
LGALLEGEGAAFLSSLEQELTHNPLMTIALRANVVVSMRWKW